MIEPCIATDDLAAMIAGDLAPERVEAVLVHVDRCGACAEVMAGLGGLGASPGEVGRYQLGRVLGAGAMGIVYDAWDPQLRRRVALKLVRPEHSDAESHDRMLREARALARISHPNVVAVYDVSEHAGQICAATELVDGETLATWQPGRTADAIVAAWIQAARGLAAAHAGGVVHRDVKPSNVLVGRDGRVRVGDFGLARLGEGPPGAAPGDVPAGSPGAAPPAATATATLPPATATAAPTASPAASPSSPATAYPRVTATGYAAGTPAYMAPEQARGVVDARSDQFALCVALTEALTDHRPVANDAPEIPGRPALGAALARGLREAPDDRFPTMGALADALADAIAPPARPRPRAAVIAAGLAVVVVAVGGGVAWLASPAAPACTAATVPGDVLPPARRASLGRVLPDGVLPRVDRWLTGWSAAANDVCAVDRDDDALRARRDRCLADALGQLRTRLDRWEAGGERAPMAAHVAIEDLPAVSSCGHAVQRSIPDPTAAQALQIIPLRLRRQLAAAAGPPPLDVARRLLGEARAIGYVPLATELAIALAELDADHVRATGVLRDAIALADAGHVALARIQARVALLGQLGADPGGEAAALADTARALITELGGDPRLEGPLDFNLGMVVRSRSQQDRSLALFERAIHEFRAAYGPDSLHEADALIGLAGTLSSGDPNGKPVKAARDAAIAIFQRAHITVPLLALMGELGGDPEGLIAQIKDVLDTAVKTQPESELVADSEYDLAAAYLIADHPALALDYYQRAAALNDKLGIKTDKQASALSQAAAILLDDHRMPEAAVYARRSADVAEAIGDDSELGSALTMLGTALLGTGDAAGARTALQRALAIRDRLHEPAQLRGNTRFVLARALWSTDRARARDLAHAARVDIQSFLDGLDPADQSMTFQRKQAAERLAAIDTWLTGHR